MYIPVYKKEESGLAEHKNSVYKKISEEIAGKIRSGEYPEGSRLEPERKLMELYGVERMTVRRALDVLAKQGLIVKKTGLGSFVSDKSMRDNLSDSGEKSADFRDNNDSSAESGKTKNSQPALNKTKNQTQEKREKAKKPSLSELSDIFVFKNDCFEGARVLCEYLAGLGHEKIAFVGCVPEFFSALAGERLKVGKYEKEMFVLSESAYDSGYEFERMYRQLRNTKPTALVTSSVAEAKDIAQTAKRLGIEVPSELTLVSFEADAKSEFTGCLYDAEKVKETLVSVIQEIAQDAENLSAHESTALTVMISPVIYEGHTSCSAAVNSRTRKGMSDYLL